MISPEPQHVDLQDVVLVPDRVLGGPSSGLLTGRLSFGWDVRPITAETVRPEWREALKPDRTYCRLVLVCTFRAETADAPGQFRSAALGLSLLCGASQPIARIVDPAVRIQPARPGATGSTKVTVGVNPGPVNLGVEHTRNAVDEEEWIVRGYGAHQATPSWDFRSTKRSPLAGDYPLEAAIELAVGGANTADVLLAAELEHRRLGIRRYRARLEPPLATIPLGTVN